MTIEETKEYEEGLLEGCGTDFETSAVRSTVFSYTVFCDKATSTDEHTVSDETAFKSICMDCLRELSINPKFENIQNYRFVITNSPDVSRQALGYINPPSIILPSKCYAETKPIVLGQNPGKASSSVAGLSVTPQKLFQSKQSWLDQSIKEFTQKSIIHEIGHLEHHNSAPYLFNSMKMGEQLKDAHIHISSKGAAQVLGLYSADNAMEYIAEMYTALATDKLDTLIDKSEFSSQKDNIKCEMLNDYILLGGSIGVIDDKDLQMWATKNHIVHEDGKTLRESIQNCQKDSRPNDITINATTGEISNAKFNAITLQPDRSIVQDINHRHNSFQRPSSTSSPQHEIQKGKAK